MNKILVLSGFIMSGLNFQDSIAMDKFDIISLKKEDVVSSIPDYVKAERQTWLLVSTRNPKDWKNSTLKKQEQAQWIVSLKNDMNNSMLPYTIRYVIDEENTQGNVEAHTKVTKELQIFKKLQSNGKKLVDILNPDHFDRMLNFTNAKIYEVCMICRKKE